MGHFSGEKPAGRWERKSPDTLGSLACFLQAFENWRANCLNVSFGETTVLQVEGGLEGRVIAGGVVSKLS